MGELVLIPGGGLIKVQDTGEVKLVPGAGLIKDGAVAAPPSGEPMAAFTPQIQFALRSAIR